MAPPQHQIVETLVELADTLVSDFDLIDYLDRLLDRSAAVLHASAGGVMLTDDRDVLQLLVATDERARMLELFELQRQEGPCVDSHAQGEPVAEHDLSKTARWPRFRAMALEQGYGSVYAFPMRLRGSVIGALNLFGKQPAAVTVEEVQAAQAIADMATIGILQQRAVREARELAAHLQSALHSRVIIEQAKGVLAERLDCEMSAAYQMLRWYARNHNHQLRAIAAAVVSGELDARALRDPRPG